MATPRGDGVTAKWLLGIAVGLLVTGGTGWMTFVQSQISAIQADQKKNETAASSQREDTGVIKEQVQELRKGQERQEENQREMNQKLDLLLRRVR